MLIKCRKVRVSVAESQIFFIQYPIEGILLIQPSLGDRIIPLAISYKKHHCWQVLRHSNRNECSPSADASYVFRCPPTAINVCSFLVGKITDNNFTVCGKGMINIRPLKAVLHTGTWKGCGGNPNCKVIAFVRKCLPHVKIAAKFALVLLFISRCRWQILLTGHLLYNRLKTSIMSLGRGSGALSPNLHEYEKHMSSRLLARMKTSSNKQLSMPIQKLKLKLKRSTIPLKAPLHSFDQIEMKESDFKPTSSCKDITIAAAAPHISCAGTSSAANVKVHGEMVHLYQHAELMKMERSFAYKLAHGHHFAYSLQNSKSIIKGRQAYIDSDRGEHMRFAVVEGNGVPMISASSHTNRMQKKTNSTTTLSTEPALICKYIVGGRVT